MKLSITLFLLSTTLLLAIPLKNIKDNFSKDEKAQLLKEFTDSSKLHNYSNYLFKKGWNKDISPKDGIDLVKTFKENSKIKYIVTYEPTSKYWAIYSPKSEYPKGESLFLKYLEPNVTFFVLANEDLEVEVKSKSINDACKKLIKDPKFNTLLDSGINKDPSMSKDHSLSIASRYYSHNEKGLYDDTRVMIIYPKINAKTKASYTYGPANPKMLLKYAKEYENQKFYTYNFKKEKCQRGIFPSPKIPPFPILQEVK